MLPQEYDQFNNAATLNEFKVGITIDQSDAQSNPNEFENRVKQNLEYQVENYKEYKDNVKFQSEDMKSTESYKSTAEMLLNSVIEGDNLVIKERLPNDQ